MDFDSAEYRGLTDKRRLKLICYSKYNSIREINRDILFNEIILKEFAGYPDDKNAMIFRIEVAGAIHYFIVRRLDWDSSYFRKEIFRLEAVLFDHNDKDLLTAASEIFISKLKEERCDYCFTDIPVEDNLVIQVLGGTGFGLVETRLHYYRRDLGKIDFPCFPVRMAVKEDIPVLKAVGRKMKNEYDRVHSDRFFKPEQADEYLATYTEACINGFADFVLVPDEENTGNAAFFAANLNNKDSEILGTGLSQFVLAAVDSDSCRGWYGKLLSGMCRLLKDKGAAFVLTTTQATNRAVIHTYEKYGFEYGHTTHVFSVTL